MTTPQSVDQWDLTTDSGGTKLIDLFIVLAKHKKLVFLFPIIVTLLAAGLSFLVPNSYLANAKLLPPQQQQSSTAAILSQLGGFAAAAAGSAGLKNPSDLYVGMLKSRTIADRLIGQYDLKKRYGTESQERARKQLENNTSVTSGKDGLIVIEVTDKDQDLVARIANSYVDELLRLTHVLAVTEASQRRVFFENQLEQAKKNLTDSEINLKQRLDTRGVISVDAESRAIVETVGRLRAQISAKEIQLSSMQAFMTGDNPDYKRVQEELSSLRNELGKLENGRMSLDEKQAGAGGKPQGMESIKLLRDVKYYQMLYELLAKQYEAARLDEAKEALVVQVLDPAVKPERPFKPKRLLIVLLAFVISSVFAIALAFVRETIANSFQTPEAAAKWKSLKSLLRTNKTRTA